MVAERETVVVGQDAGSMDFADRGGDLRTEDLTMDAIDVMVNGTGEGLVSPGRQHLVDDILPGHGWDASPMSPVPLFSPSRVLQFYGTPTKDQNAIGSTLFTSPARPFQSPSPSTVELSFAGLETNSPFPSSLQMDPRTPTSGLGLTLRSPARELLESTPQKPRTFKRILAVSDFIEASTEKVAKSSLAKRHGEENVDPLQRRRRESHPYASIWQGRKRTRYDQPVPMGRGTPAKLRFESLDRAPPTGGTPKVVLQEHPVNASSGEASEPELLTCRNCKEGCLKGYCVCFGSGNKCRPECKCLNCFNTDEHEAEIDDARKRALERNPHAFESKFQSKQGVDGEAVASLQSHSRGCNCRKSGCSQKYCVCYKAGVPCGHKCTCQGCKNCDPPGPKSGVTGGSVKVTAPILQSIRAHGSAIRPIPRRLEFDHVESTETPKRHSASKRKFDINGARRRISMLHTSQPISSPHRPPVPLYPEF